jgi:hypothetical protein
MSLPNASPPQMQNIGVENAQCNTLVRKENVNFDPEPKK